METKTRAIEEATSQMTGIEATADQIMSALPPKGRGVNAQSPLLKMPVTFPAVGIDPDWVRKAPEDPDYFFPDDCI